MTNDLYFKNLYRNGDKVHNSTYRTEELEKLPTGYEGASSVPKNFNLPPCRFKDIDQTIFNLFNKKLKLHVDDSGGTRKDIRARFAGMERFAALQRKLGMADESQTLQPPLIAIKRVGYDISQNLGGMGRTLGVDTGVLEIRRRLAESDTKYQNIVNKYNIENQDNISKHVDEYGMDGNKLLSDKEKGNLKPYGLSRDYLEPRFGNNIFEIIQMPFPKYILAHYEVMLWTTHVQHMHQILEQMIASFDNQQNEYVSESDNGHQMVVYLEDDLLSFDDNFSDYSEEEREIKMTIKMKIRGQIYGLPNSVGKLPFKSYLSAPVIEESIDIGETCQELEDIGIKDYSTIYDQEGNPIYIIDERSFSRVEKVYQKNIKGLRFIKADFSSRSGECVLHLTPAQKKYLKL